MGRFPETYNDPPALGRRVTLSAESTLASFYMRKKITPLPEPTRFSDFLALTELTRLGGPNLSKVFFGKKLSPARRVTLPFQLGGSLFEPF